MNKKKIYSYNWVAVLCFLLGGCDSFLNHEPDDRLTINSLERIAQTVTGAYNNYGTRFTDMSSDNVGLVDGVYYTEIPMEDLYIWNRDIRNPEHQDSPGAFWTHAYDGIANVNIALEALDKLELKKDENSRAGAIRGEALVLRSYYHFMLVNLFAPHYDEKSAAHTPGVPYMKIVEKQLIAHYERATVEEVYRQAEEDLLEGIRLIEENRGEFNNNKYHFTLPTVYLYASRFYLFRNRNSGAQRDIDAAINFSEKSLQAFGGVGGMRDWLEYAKDNYGMVDVNRPEVGMVQESTTWTVYEFSYNTTMVIKNEQLRNPFNFKDNRQEMAYKASGNTFTPAFYYAINYNEGTTLTDIFPLSEAILNAAEAYARNHDYTKAEELLHTFGSHVYDKYDKSKVNREWLAKYYGYFDEENREELGLIDYILFERRVHFLFQGKRWFDIRRYGLDVEHELMNGDVIWLSDVAPNRDYQIPRFAIEAGMTPNTK